MVKTAQSQGHDLMAGPFGADQDTRDPARVAIVTGMRAICRAAKVMDKPLTVENLAQATGLSVYQIDAALHDPQFRDMFHDAARTECMTQLSRLLGRTQGLIAKGTAREALDAGKLVLQTYKVLLDSAPKQETEEGRGNLIKLIQTVKDTNQATVQKIEAVSASSS